MQISNKGKRTMSKHTVKKARKELLRLLQAHHDSKILGVDVLRVEFKLPGATRFELNDILKVYARLTGDSTPAETVCNPQEVEYYYNGLHFNLRSHRKKGVSSVATGSWRTMKIVAYGSEHDITVYDY